MATKKKAIRGRPKKVARHPKIEGYGNWLMKYFRRECDVLQGTRK